MNNSCFDIGRMADYFCVSRIRQTGGEFDQKCPVCGDKKFHIDTANNRCFCNHCGQGGGSMHYWSIMAHGVPYDRDPDLKRTILREISDAFSNGAEYKPVTPVKTKKSVEYPSDSVCNAVYQRILKSPLTELVDSHRADLHRRGLTDSDIERLQYRSFSLKRVAREGISQDTKEFFDDEIATRCIGWDTIRRIGKATLAGYLEMGRSVADLKPVNVPGIFSIKGKDGRTWYGINMINGYLIPIRNALGEVVGMQVRSMEKNPKAKYMAFSSRGLPGGIKGRNRVHHPLANHSESRKDSMEGYFTEGPMKADIIAILADRVASYSTSGCVAAIHRMKSIAIVGVSCTKDMIQDIKSENLTKVYNALDMDRYLNLDVAKASGRLRSKLKNAGFEVGAFMWDTDRMDNIIDVLTKTCEAKNLSVKSYQSKVHHLMAITHTLHDNRIKFSHNWDDDLYLSDGKSSKGLDDYLLSYEIPPAP